MKQIIAKGRSPLFTLVSLISSSPPLLAFSIAKLATRFANASVIQRIATKLFSCFIEPTTKPLILFRKLASVLSPAHRFDFPKVYHFMGDTNRPPQNSSNVSTDNLFITLLSHDLLSSANLLHSLIQLQKLDTAKASPLSDEWLSKIEQASTFQLELLNNLLHWGKLRSNGSKTSETKCHLWDEIECITATFQPLHSDKRLNIINLIPKETLVYTDQNLLRTVLRNLISNAVKFTPAKGSIKIESNLQTNSVVTKITNESTPIREDSLATLGNCFISSTPGTQGEKGLGLGLMLCRQLLQEVGSDLIIQGDKKNVMVSFTFPTSPATCPQAKIRHYNNKSS